MNVNAPIHCWQVWEDKPFSIVEKYQYVPPNFELIADPSDSMILRNKFRREDIVDRFSGHVWDCWVPGTQFKHARTGKIMEVYIETTKKVINNRWGTKTVKTVKTLRWKEVKETDQLVLKGL